MRRVLVAGTGEFIDAARTALAGELELAAAYSVAQALEELERGVALVLCNVRFDDSRMFDFLGALNARVPGRMPVVCCRLARAPISGGARRGIELALEALGVAAFLDLYELEQRHGAAEALARLRATVMAHLGESADDAMLVDLVAHPDTPCAGVRSLRAGVARAPEGLAVHYRIEGDLERLRIAAPGRRAPGERLWEHSCCEIFVAAAGAQAYREYNFSPSGQWACFAFQRYREGRPVPTPDPGIAVRRSPDRLELEAGIPAPPGKLHIALCAVIEDREGVLSYWALRHARGKPDFHHAEAFALELD